MSFPGTEQARLAHDLGYGEGPEAIANMNAEHDWLHLKLCALLGAESRCLALAADGTEPHPSRDDDVLGWEEDLVLESARWLNTGEFKGRTLRVLWWLGFLPDEIRRYLRGE